MEIAVMSYPKTVHLTNFYHAASGGISAFYRALFQHANECGREIRLIVPGEQSGCEKVGNCGKIFRVRAPHSPFGDRRYRLVLPIGECRREVARILRLEQPDILEVSDKYTLPYISGILRKHLLRGIKRPTEIATSHERLDVNVSAYLMKGALGGWFARFYMRYVYFPMFDHHIANSEYTAAELVPASAGHTTRRGIWVCPMGVDNHLFSDKTRRPHEGKRVLYAGRLSTEKNTGVLVDLIGQLPQDYSLIIAGDGPQRLWLMEQASKLAPGRIQFKMHFRDREEFAQELADADAFVHPNPREPFGITPLEAMACGVPVVAPSAGGVLSYANSGNAWLCEATAKEFAKAVESVFADSIERERRVSVARVTARNFDWKAIAARYFRVIDTLHEKGFQIEVPPLGAALDAWRMARQAHPV
jgi:glycosyltransferase involved in cell wall biosynthesis